MSIHILLVDDNEVFRRPLQRALEVAGFEVVAVSSAEDALDALDRGTADLLLTDHRLPGIEAPRSQDVQAPRSQDVQAPRSAELKKAATLVKEADAACNAGNSAMATEKAKAAMQLLKKEPAPTLTARAPRGCSLWGCY